MRLPDPPERYDPDHQREVSARLEQEDAQNRKKGRDVEIGSARLILTSPNGTRYAVAVDNTGILSTSVV